MGNHPWGGSTPEMNATMLEAGSTSATWAAASAAWMGLASAAMAAAGITGAQMAASTTSGHRSTIAAGGTDTHIRHAMMHTDDTMHCPVHLRRRRNSPLERSPAPTAPRRGTGRGRRCSGYG